MRVILGGLAALVISTNAWSADMLRGSAPAFGEARSYNWAGVYFGAQGGYANADFAFGNEIQPLINELQRGPFISEQLFISQWPATSDGNESSGSYGGFVGYNSQWGDIVLGTELNYNRTSLTAESAQDIVQRVFVGGGIDYDVTVRSTASARLTDYGTLRFRAGYAYNWIMPYAMVGIAAGRADVTRRLELTGAQPPPASLGFLPLAATQTKNGAISIGYMAGLGVDIGLMPGVFLRAEYEFIQFGGFDDVPARINTGRLALGVKF